MRNIHYCVEENKDWKPLQVRDEENTKSEIDTTNNPICPEGSRVVQKHTLLLFPIFS